MRVLLSITNTHLPGNNSTGCTFTGDEGFAALVRGSWSSGDLRFVGVGAELQENTTAWAQQRQRGRTRHASVWAEDSKLLLSWWGNKPKSSGLSFTVPFTTPFRLSKLAVGLQDICHPPLLRLCELLLSPHQDLASRSGHVLSQTDFYSTSVYLSLVQTRQYSHTPPTQSHWRAYAKSETNCNVFRHKCQVVVHSWEHGVYVAVQGMTTSGRRTSDTSFGPVPFSTGSSAVNHHRNAPRSEKPLVQGLPVLPSALIYWNFLNHVFYAVRNFAPSTELWTQHRRYKIPPGWKASSPSLV